MILSVYIFMAKIGLFFYELVQVLIQATLAAEWTVVPIPGGQCSKVCGGGNEQSRTICVDGPNVVDVSMCTSPQPGFLCLTHFL